MTETTDQTTPARADPAPARAAVSLRAGGLVFEARAALTPGAFLAIGGMIGTILLSTAVLVWTATSVRRRHPIASSLIR